jgi:hypothetical protein
MVERPIIHMIAKPERIPFDVQGFRAIPYSLKNPSSYKAARAALTDAVRAVEEPGYEVSNPVKHSRGVAKLAQSSDSTDRIVAGLAETVRGLEQEIAQLRMSIVLSDPSASLKPYNFADFSGADLSHFYGGSKEVKPVNKELTKKYLRALSIQNRKGPPSGSAQ